MRVKALKIRVMTNDQIADEAAEVAEAIRRGKPPASSEGLIFRSIEDLRRFITPERLRLMRIIRQRKPKSVYELARLAERDRKAVEEDLRMLVQMRLVTMTKTSAGRVRSTPHVAFTRLDIELEV